ncbi:YvcK family protein [Pseudolactococcus paracarnosus]|uniref:Putative gluconeogenesis factor n=1 Tax=Pseudolactococcus paracarnosus TaxID=2749962 RepID=A0A7L4WEL9_9LACT|nr:YvcK family protein [Lactococcus paracarnosus]SPC35770.1 gluconeogenesis morphogenetic factor [Lactococcus piscium]MCJ1976523.1 YvcK family protein [Lactococcus paracarnosus]MCJ1982688.1 YvcK family protein [Lactococcus paracarnosus]MCJ1994524.1 YvcK family protein [Lactococcus paracarnosus]MCJ1997698.1 YvcK family protein [Lactococcus paracarnosus]
MRKKKIVVIGGGTGIPVILNALRKEDVDLTAIVTVADDGGSSGELRGALDIAPPGDLRNVLVAMSDMPRLYEQIFQYRFKADDGPLKGHPIGNLVIAGVSEMQGSTYNAIQILAKFFHVQGRILPSSEAALTLHAVFQDKKEVIGESHIADYPGKIDHVYVTNTNNQETPTASRHVVTEIMAADTIVMGPGSLFTSILPNVVIPEIREALIQTTAQVVYVCNIMTQRGETENFTDADHVNVLHQHVGTQFIDTVLVNVAQVPDTYMNTNKFDEYLVQVRHDFSGLQAENIRIISNDFLKLVDGGAFHNGDAVAQEIMRISERRML